MVLGTFIEASNIKPKTPGASHGEPLYRMVEFLTSMILLSESLDILFLLLYLAGNQRGKGNEQHVGCCRLKLEYPNTYINTWQAGVTCGDEIVYL